MRRHTELMTSVSTLRTWQHRALKAMGLHEEDARKGASVAIAEITKATMQARAERADVERAGTPEDVPPEGWIT